MDLRSKVRKVFTKSKFNTMETLETQTVIPGTPTRYGKKLELNATEKSELLKGLTARETETFYILLEGYSLKEAAKQLGIGYSTANTYQTAIYKKLHVNSRAELIINYRDLHKTKEE